MTMLHGITMAMKKVLGSYVSHFRFRYQETSRPPASPGKANFSHLSCIG